MVTPVAVLVRADIRQHALETHRLRFSAKRPPDRGLANVILSGELGHGLTHRITLGNLAALAIVESFRTAEPPSVTLGALDPFLIPVADQRPFEFGNAAMVSTRRLTACRGFTWTFLSRLRPFGRRLDGLGEAHSARV
jgi:hypothetical protein